MCFRRKLDKDVIGKFTVIMADPPWDIHMELPYGTMTDDEMRNMGVEKVQVSPGLNRFFKKPLNNHGPNNAD